MTPEQERMLKETCESTKSVEQLLKGYNGFPGLCAEFQTHKEEDRRFRAKFYAFRLGVIVVLTLVAGGSGYSIAELLK
jgi:hypothetical protein